MIAAQLTAHLPALLQQFLPLTLPHVQRRQLRPARHLQRHRGRGARGGLQGTLAAAGREDVGMHGSTVRPHQDRSSCSAIKLTHLMLLASTCRTCRPWPSP